jgi:hypothetical protein
VKETKIISAHRLQIDGSFKPSDRMDFYHEGHEEHEEHEGGFAAKASYRSFIFLRVLRDLRVS